MNRPQLWLSSFHPWILIALCACQNAAEPSRGDRAPTAAAPQSPRDLVKDGATLLDVRTVAEFADGHIQGATNIPIAELEGRTAEIPANRPVVVYCKSGRRSERAAKLLKEQGYEVHDMGAMSSW